MIEIQENVNLGQWTSWQVGGAAQYYCAPENEEEIEQSLLWAHNNEMNLTILGSGTNVLIHDQGVPGLVLHTYKFKDWGVREQRGRLVFNGQAGVEKSEALKVFLKYRLAPAVMLAGLPGDIGGGVVMNAGVGHSVEPREFCEIVDGFEVLKINPETHLVEKYFYNNQNITWKYRHCLGWQPGVITQIQLSWPLEPDEDVLEKVRDSNKRRKLTQPLSDPSCGSVFKNPPGHHSGALIEKAGLKGFKIGGAEVSTKHANFIINSGKASAKDIHQLMVHVQKTVKEEFSVSLTNEVVYMGWPIQDQK